MTRAKRPLKIDMSSYLSRHDIVFLSAPSEGWEGLPIGNGRMGGPVWVKPNGLRFQLNHTDTWDNHYDYDSPSPGDREFMALRALGQLRIEHTIPAYDWIYMDDFEARLAMHEAEVSVSCQSGLGSFRWRAFVHADLPVAVFHHQAQYSSELGPSGAGLRVSLDRWGSRLFGWWYSGIKAGAATHLGKARSGCDGGTAWIEESFDGVSAAVAMRVVGTSSTAAIDHAHSVNITVPAAPVHEFTVLVSAATSHDSDNPLRAAREALDKAEEQSIEGLAKSHRKWWTDFWSRSFLHIGEDYLENLYYFYLYLMGSSSRGHYPAVFNGGLWLWNRDVHNWVNPHHWNQQQLTWALFAANRLELLKPTQETYFRMMPKLAERAERRGSRGIFLVEQHSFAGEGESGGSWDDNFTPAPQVAMQFWWAYQYGGDKEFLRQRAHPFMSAVAEFYLGYLQWDEERKEYAVPYSSTYECGKPIRFKNAVTDLAMIRALFKALIEASQILDIDADKQKEWQHVLDHLPSFLFNNREPERGEIVARGIVIGTNDVPEKEDHDHGPLFCPVFPAGIVGLKDRGTRLFEAEVRTLRTFPKEINAIVPCAVIAARLGLADVAIERLKAEVRGIQFFPNGQFSNLDHAIHLRGYLVGPKGEEAMSQRDYLYDRRCKYKQVRVSPPVENDSKEGERRVDTPAYPFIQPGLETLGHFAAGIQEMLLQSCDGTIRAFPAAPEEWEGAFTLRTVGGFIVSASRGPGKPADFVQVESLLGGPCRIVNPWGKTVQVAEITDAGQTRTPATASQDQTITFETEAGRTYLLTPEGAMVLEKVTFPGERNTGPKRFHEAVIGRERNF